MTGRPNPVRDRPMRAPRPGGWGVGLVGLALVALAGCETLAYYGQAVSGHLSLMTRREPIGELLVPGARAPELQRRLRAALDAREFATRELALPDNGSYRTYVALDRPYVVWNVVVAPALSLRPERWCYVVAGCVSYRGYYDESAAAGFAAHWRARGFDVAVSGVRAYSTLGWFDDPLLSPMLAGPDDYVAGVVFHELAHQRVYLKGDTAFNEAFAVAVEQAGARRWLAGRGDRDALAALRARERRRADFIGLLLRTRTGLAEIYADPRSSVAEKTASKARTFAALRLRYARLRRSWGGDRGYDHWLERDLNNAKLALVATYHRRVPAFERMLEAVGGDFAAFYRAVDELAALPRPAREARLEGLLAAPG